MNVVIYARYSSHMQTEQSIEGQLKVCYDFAKKNNMTVIREYIDRAISGTSDNRPYFQKMIEDSHKKTFQGVLVYQLDRFARNRYDSAIYKAKLKKNNVRVFSAKENISDDASGILVEGLLESMAEYYSVELSQKVKRGFAVKAEKNLVTNGSVPLGFKMDENHKFVIDPPNAQLVKIIFEMYVKGNSIKQITDYMNSNNYKTSKGSEFNKNSLRKMLRNKRYIGVYTYKGIERKDSIPRIISDELFQQVAELLEKNQKAPARAKAKEEYLLTTKLFCGHCHALITGESGTSKTGKLHHYYKCNAAKRKKCNKKSVRKEYIENLVVNHCRGMLTDENINKITKEVIRIFTAENDETEIKRLNNLLKENERKQNNLVVAISECDLGSARQAFYGQIAKLDSERKLLNQQMAQLKLSRIDITESEVKFFLTKLKDGDINDEKYRKLLINVFVQAIYLYDDKLTIIFNTSNQPLEIGVSLIEQIEANNKEFESSFLESSAPYGVSMKTPLGVFFLCLCYD